LVAESPWSAIDIDACYRYILSRQTRQGGFCFYTHPEWGVEEPNAPDTWAALEVIAKLGRPTPKPLRCIAWLRAQQDGFGRYPTLTIGNAVLKALRRLRAEPERDPRPFLLEASEGLQLAVPNAGRGEGWLLSALQCVELLLLYDIVVSAHLQRTVQNALDTLRGSEGAYGAAGPNLPDTALALALAVAVGLPPPVDALSYARRCEGPPHGFNITPHATSSALESQRAGMLIHRHFGEPPCDPGRIRRFVAACQSASGGFCRVPGAIPRLDDTLCALETLEQLPGVERLER
jgi:hypothetical protein